MKISNITHSSNDNAVYERIQGMITDAFIYALDNSPNDSLHVINSYAFKFILDKLGISYTEGKNTPDSSHYYFIKREDLPSGEHKVRFADHSNQSQHYTPSATNVSSAKYSDGLDEAIRMIANNWDNISKKQSISEAFLNHSNQLNIEPKNDNIDIHSGTTDSQRDSDGNYEHHGYTLAVDKATEQKWRNPIHREADHRPAGLITWSLYKDVLAIKMIEVVDDYKRQGIGLAMLSYLKRKYPNAEIDFGYVTDDGKALVESETKTLALYHGTCEDSAQSLVDNGWKPSSGVSGGNQGQSKYLYVTNVPENAMWFANEKGCDTLVKISNIPISYLAVDPEDGTEDTVEAELSKSSGTPAYLVLRKELPKEHFEIVSDLLETEIKTYYHGTKAHDKVSSEGFSYDYIGKGEDQYGYGFYFTDTEETADVYGKTIKAKLDIKNPIIINGSADTTLEQYPELTHQQVKKILSVVPDIKDPDGVLSDFGDIRYEGFQAVLATAIESYTDKPSAFFDLMNDFFKGRPKEFLKAFSDATGYDGVQVNFNHGESFMVAWFPEQIKIQKEAIAENTKSNISDITNVGKIEDITDSQIFNRYDSALYHRFTNNPNSARNDVDYMMFVDSDGLTSVETGYGQHHYIFSADFVGDKTKIIHTNSPKFQQKVYRALLQNPYELEVFGADEDNINEVAKQLVYEFNPDDIVNSAGAWDSPELVTIVANYSDIFDRWQVFITEDGCIVTNPKYIKKVIPDDSDNLIAEATFEKDVESRQKAVAALKAIRKEILANGLSNFKAQGTGDKLSFYIFGEKIGYPEIVFLFRQMNHPSVKSLASLSHLKKDSSLSNLGIKYILSINDLRKPHENFDILDFGKLSRDADQRKELANLFLHSAVQSVFVHEMVHYFDALRYKKHTPKSSEGDEYFNSAHEFNAYFIQGLHTFLEYYGHLLDDNSRKTTQKVWNNISTFVNDVIEIWYSPFVKSLDSKNRKRFLKRLSIIWKDFIMADDLSKYKTINNLEHEIIQKVEKVT